MKFYFDGDDTKTFINVCCADFVAQGQNDELRIEVEMWVEDEEGNKDYCKTVVIVQDNQDIVLTQDHSEKSPEILRQKVAM
ncbi:MAG: hypothetical protein IPP06_07495 [Saprospiraceae bacterium]|nr:hypothetical protein [Candidatus Vicinibacter affinis]